MLTKVYSGCFALLLLFSLVFCSPLLAKSSTDLSETPGDDQPHADAIALVLGEPIFLSDITPDSDTLRNIRNASPQFYTSRLMQMRASTLTNQIIEAVLLDYGQQQNITVDPELVEKFKQKFGAEYATEYAKNNKQVEEELVSTSQDEDPATEKSLDDNATASIDEVARVQVQRWQIEKQLYAHYGGVVLFKQSNPQMPIEAYLALMMEYKNSGKLTILDSTFAALFWKAFEPPYEFVIAPENLDFSQPWWL